MRTPYLLLTLFTALTLGATAKAADTSAPQPFTATYTVLRGGSAIGTSTLTLRRTADGHWRYRSSLKATHGLAALFGADIHEVSTFRWHDDSPEALSYDYRLDSGIKDRHRHVQVDWSRQRVSVDIDGRRHYSYASAAGLVERHSVPLALALALRKDRQTMDLPVAVKNRVERQRYRVAGHESVTVPAGHFQAIRVDRVDDAKGFAAWYVPGRYLAPVKLTQSSGGHITMLLESYHRP